MRLDQLIAGLPIAHHGERSGDARVQIAAVVDDSRLVTPGCLFIARAGAAANGREYIADAVARGAVAVLADDAAAIPQSTIALTSPDVAAAGAALIERSLGSPSAKLVVIGVTGTNGKTTTAWLIQQMLHHAGVRCGLMGTVLIDDGVTRAPAMLTTPGPVETSKALAAMVANGCSACAMEISSHALHQKRAGGIQVRVGIFTNLTGDHLDYHGTMDAYRDAKAMLFAALPRDGVAIINGDDPAGAAMARQSAAPVLTCSMSDASADCAATILHQTILGTRADFRGPWGSLESDLPLLGRHNVFNAMQALAACHALGLELDQLRPGLAQCAAPPGRLEPVAKAGDGFAVLVDYAHTDDALDNVLRTLRPIADAGGGKLRVVFGCGGDRDRGKRPRMARVAAALADDVIITSDNPRTDDPQAIIAEVLAGIPVQDGPGATCIVDRAEAISAAVDRAAAGDIVLIAGKGHEDYQIIGTTRRPFDDRLVARAALAQRRQEDPRRRPARTPQEAAT